jgi:hypothetical protein
MRGACTLVDVVDRFSTISTITASLVIYGRSISGLNVDCPAVAE